MPLDVRQSGHPVSATSPDGGSAFPLNVTSPGGGGLTQIATGQVTVGTSATSIIAVRSGRVSAIIVNHGTTELFLGPAAVTIGNGLKIIGTAGTAVTIDGGAAIFGIVAAGTQVVSFIEMF